MKQTRRPESGSKEGCQIESAVHVVNPRVNGMVLERQPPPTEAERQERGAGEGGCNSEQKPQQILCEVDQKEVKCII